MEDELMFDGIDDEDSMELEESTKTLVAERSMVSNQLLSKSQRKKSSLERAVSSSLVGLMYEEYLSISYPLLG